jgi:hypothetical protein
MEIASKAIELTGKIDAHRRLVLDDALPITGPRNVRVIILVPDEEDIDESEWLQAAYENPSFAFLKDPEEDIYSISDGKPFNDKK